MKHQIEFNPSQQAFNKAINETGLFSTDPKAWDYAGKFMYMGTDNGVDMFKHIMWRSYVYDSLTMEKLRLELAN